MIFDAAHNDDYERINCLLEPLAEKDHLGPKCMELRLELFPKSASGLRGMSGLATAPEVMDEPIRCLVNLHCYP